jgi:hypothetical protein
MVLGCRERRASARPADRHASHAACIFTSGISLLRNVSIIATLAAIALATTAFSAARVEGVVGSAPSCPGDCNGNGSVDVAELVAGVNALLGRSGVFACPILDRNADGQITIDELVVAVDNAVEGCFGVCADLDQEIVDQLVFDSVFGKVQLKPGGRTRLQLGVIECCVYVETVDTCVSWSVEPADGAWIDRRGVLHIGPGAPPGSVFTVTADVEHGRARVSTEAYVYTPETNPFVGFYWQEDTQFSCVDGSSIEPKEKIQEVLFYADGTFTVTWHPFEVYIDYWGTYDFDLETGRFTWAITNGNYIPPDIDGSGTFVFDSEGGLRLVDLWLGRRSDEGTTACGHRLVRAF